MIYGNRAIASRVHGVTYKGWGWGLGRTGVFSYVVRTLAGCPAAIACGERDTEGGSSQNKSIQKVEIREIGLTRVARSSPQWRRPTSPQAINTINGHISPRSSLDE